MSASPFRKTGPDRGSHLPVLMKLVSITSGPIIEMGCGMYSTPYLHWACYATKRPLTTCESKPDWMDFINQFANDFHKVINVPDWSLLDLSGQWSIGFVDHDPDETRINQISRMPHVEYVVAHDADNRTERKYHYRKAMRFFKYCYTYSGARPNTAIWSNVHDLCNMVI